MLPNLLLAAILLAAQFGMALHPVGHEAGLPQTTVCKTCIAADQLSAASIDQHADTELDLSGSTAISVLTADFPSVRALPARQRGPPASTWIAV